MSILLLAACHHPPPTPVSSTSTPAPTEPVERLVAVSSYFGGAIYLFAPADGALVGAIAGVAGAQTIVDGPSGEWVAAAELDNRIVTVDPDTFEITGALVEDDPATPTDETGGLKNPDGAAFGPDGRLYVSSFETDQVLRYEADGTFVDVFVAANSGGMNGPDIGIGFDPAGNLVVPGYYSDSVHRYDGTTGAYLDDVVDRADGLGAPRAVRFDADGAAWVSGHDSDNVLKVGPGGAVSTAIVFDRASGFAFDGERVLVATAVDDTVHAFDLASGEDEGVFVDHAPIDGVTAVGVLTR